MRGVGAGVVERPKDDACVVAEDVESALPKLCLQLLGGRAHALEAHEVARDVPEKALSGSSQY